MVGMAAQLLLLGAAAAAEPLDGPQAGHQALDGPQTDAGFGALRVFPNGSRAVDVSTTPAGGGLSVRALRFGQFDPSHPRQLHEVVTLGSSVYVSAITTSQLFELRAGADGLLNATVAAFTFNSMTDGGLHNIALSACHPGMLWISTQYDNQIHLIDPSSGFRPTYSMGVPRLLHNGEDGWHERLSEPHSVREDPKTCKVWVALKGATRILSPGEEDLENDADYTELYDAMTTLNQTAWPSNHTDGHAVWEIQPADYNRSTLPAFGGKLHGALPTPVMSAIDRGGNVWTAQDQSPSLLHVDSAGVERQVPVSHYGWKASGPGVVTAPDGSVWVCSLTREDGMLLRFRPNTIVPEPFSHISGRHRTIHLAFDDALLNGTAVNVMYVLTSSLLLQNTEPAEEEVVAFAFDSRWELVSDEPVWSVTLPVQHSATHRIAVLKPAGGPRSLVVSGMLADVLFQITSAA